VNDDLRTLLDDLARYLDQQRAAGSSFYLEADAPPGGTPADAGDASVAVDPVTPAPAEPSTPTPPAGEPAPAAAKQEREEAFRRECEAFVRDTLALVARTRAHVPTRPAPDAEQANMFGADPGGVPDQPDPPALPETIEERAAALEAIAAEARACTACLLHGSRQQAVPGVGHPAAGLVLVGEAPGAEEDRQGLPFVGRSGQLLTDILKAIGFARDDVFICNILKCRPPGNRDPERDEVAACEPYLRRQLAVIRPRLICCLGRVAAQTLLGTTAPLGSLRRSVHFYAGVPVMATYHPAALLRNPANKRHTWDDVRKLRALYDALDGHAV
jgi:DNA polymerase